MTEKKAFKETVTPEEALTIINRVFRDDEDRAAGAMLCFVLYCRKEKSGQALTHAIKDGRRGRQPARTAPRNYVDCCDAGQHAKADDEEGLPSAALWNMCRSHATRHARDAKAAGELDTLACLDEPEEHTEPTMRVTLRKRKAMRARAAGAREYKRADYIDRKITDVLNKRERLNLREADAQPEQGFTADGIDWRETDTTEIMTHYRDTESVGDYQPAA